MNVHIRAYDPSTDVPDLLALCNAIEQHDQTHESVTEADLLNEDGQSRAYWVALLPAKSNRMVGHAWLLKNPARAYMLVAVHPDYRRRGIGTALLQQINEACGELGIAQIIAFFPANCRPFTEGFMQRHGFRLAGQNRQFSAPTVLPNEAPQWPAGFVVKTYAEVNQVEVLAAAFNCCYGDRWGHHENRETLTIEQLQEYMTAYPDAFIPDGMLIVYAPDGEIAGTVSGRLLQDPPRRVIDSPGVAPQYRAVGLHRPLVLWGLAWCQTRRDGAIELATYGDTASEAALYESMGFTLEPYNHWLEYVVDVVTA